MVWVQRRRAAGLTPVCQETVGGLIGAVHPEPSNSVQVSHLPVIRVGGLHLRHRLAGMGPVERAVSLGPVERLDAPRGQAGGQSPVVDPCVVAVEAGGQGEGQYGHGETRRHDGSQAPRANPLAPHEEHEQCEEQNALEVGQARTEKSRGNDRQGHERESGAGQAKLAPLPGHEGEDQGGVQQQHGRAQQDGHPNPLVDPYVGQGDARKGTQSLSDGVGADRDPEVNYPAQGQPGGGQR